MACDYYCLPSLLDLSLHCLCRPGHLPPTTELHPLPPHLKDGLRRRLAKRGALSGPQLAALVHREVKDIDLSDCSVTGEHMLAMVPCKRLTKLNLNQPRHQAKRHKEGVTSDHQLSTLLESCCNLSVLHLRDCSNSVSDQVATLLPPTLLHLDLGGCARLSDPGVQALAVGCPRLSSLSLARTAVTDLGLSRLGIAQCRNFLQELKVDGCRRLTDLGVELLLDGLSRLRILSFHSCPGVTERAREALEVYLGQGRVRQLTWTVY